MSRCLPAASTRSSVRPAIGWSSSTPGKLRQFGAERGDLPAGERALQRTRRLEYGVAFRHGSDISSANIKGVDMATKKLLLSLAAVGAVILAVSFTRVDARQAGGAVAIDADDIGGVVTSTKGPEAGVWVIAETTDLPTKFGKIVVTDDRGRYLMPDLPKATYSVWVRGYGLVDSQKVQTAPGATLEPHRRRSRRTPHAAAQYYPAGYWWSLLRVPAKSEFPGTGPTGNGISPNMRTQAELLRQPEVGRLLGVSSAGQQGDARDSQGARHVSRRPCTRGIGAFSPDRPAATWSADSTRSAASARCRCLPTGPIASPKASCRRRRRGRRASSATS